MNNFISNREINRKRIIYKIQTDKRWNNQVDFIQKGDQVKPSWFGLSMLINKKIKKNKKMIINKLDRLGIETRPIIGGNFLKQPALKKYNLKQKSSNFPNANYVHEHGLLVGLKNKTLSYNETKKFADIFFKAFNI